MLIRCEAGADPVDIGIGRELKACLDETGAARAILVAPAGVSKRLEQYLVNRLIEVVDPQQILGSPALEL